MQKLNYLTLREQRGGGCVLEPRYTCVFPPFGGPTVFDPKVPVYTIDIRQTLVNR